MVSAKGKEKVTDYGGKGKRKLRPGEGGGDDDKTGRKRKNRGVLHFIEDAAYQVDEDEDSSDDSSLGSGFSEEEELESEFRVNNEPGKVSQLPYVKEEEMSEEEYDRFFEERYKPGAGFVRYAEDGHDNKNSMDSDIYVMSDKDPKIWKVKCMIGRERYSALCLMQKYADLAYLGNKLQIISACALDHVRGFIVIEADKQNDIYEACKGLSTIYSSKVTAVPDNEISRLLSVRSKSSAISEGMWARVKNGRYKGDLAQVVAVNDVKKKVTVRLIPRIDLKSMAQKFGGGIPAKRTDIPAQRLITSSELVEFRPLIQIRRDRDTNLTFEVLDGMMLKDGCLYKKLSMDSLIFWGVIPTEDELLKFEPAKKDESTDVQWLTQLFGEKKKKEDERIKPKLSSKGGKGGGKSEGSSSTNSGHNFEMHDLVFIGRKDFGVVIGTGKDDSVQVIKAGSEGPLIVDVKPSELKIASFDRKLFTVLDQHSNTLTINDDVRVLDGPLKGRQGTIKKIYKGILFLYDESEQENNGYICIKAQLCEKVNVSGNDPSEKDTEPVVSGFADLTSSPKSSLSPDKSLQDMDTKSKFSRDDNEMFSVGQSLRIRVGPLKGYICRVLAVRRSDVTVKLDSKHKIITVKSDHLSEVHGRNPAVGQGEDSGSAKPFDFLGGQESSRDWMDGAALSAEDNKWNPGGSSERTSWSAVPSSDVSSPKQSGFDPAGDDSKKEDSSWQVKQTPDQSSSWGAAAANNGWGKLAEPQLGGSREPLQDDSWGKAAEQWNSGGDTSASKAAWGQSGVLSGKQIDGDLNQPETNAWQKDPAESSLVMESESRTWGGASNAHAVTDNNQTDSWNKPTSVGADKDNKSSWGRSEGTTSWSKQDCGSSLGKKDDESSWNKDGGGWASNKLSGESSWGKSVGQSSWGQQSGVNAEDKTKGWGDQSKKSEGSGGDQGFGGWKKGGVGNRDDTRHEGSWARSNTFDSGRGSGGRGRGGRGRGRSYDQGQSGSWNKEGQFGGLSDAGKPTSWSSDQSGGWGKSLSNDGSKDKDVGSGWNLGSNANKDGEEGQGWGGAVPSTDSKPSGWNDSSGWGKPSNTNDEAEKGKGWGGAMPSTDNKPSGWNDSSGWGKPSNTNEESAAAGSGVSSWDKIQKPDENNKSSWNAATTSVDGNQSSGWGKEGSWGNQKAPEENSGWNQSSVGNGKDNFSNSWTDTKKNEGSSTGWKKNEGSSTGWGKSNWSKSGTSEGDGNQDSTWSSKSNWNSGGGFGDNNNQDGGRGGGWRGRGGRGDRGGGFRGRGGSDGGGFGGRGGSGRGRFGGRGEYGGRGGSDREGGFRGRGGGFRGRGRGDWNNREENSNQDKSSSWGKGSNSDGEGWKSSSGYGNSWKARDNDNGSSSSWNQSKGSGSSWNQSNQGDAPGGGSSWGAPPPNNSETGVAARDEGAPSDSWGKAASSEKTAGSSWGAPPANKNSEAGGADDSWGKAAAQKSTGSSWGAPPAEKDEGASWGGKAATSSWGSGSGKGGGGR